MLENVYLSDAVKGIRDFYATADEIRMTRVAIALERYRRKYRSVPLTIDAMIPEFLEGIPAGSIPGQRIQYRPGANTGYELWTDGWNEIKDGGIAGETLGCVIGKEPDTEQRRTGN